MTDCSICLSAVIDYPAPDATGSHRSSCGHAFHPKCIAKWQIGQNKRTCPMCRKVAGAMEGCAPEPEEEDSGGVIQISRAGLEFILRDFGCVGITASVEAGLQIDEFNVVTIERSELARILQEQGGTPLSDAQWTRLTSVYPPAEHNDDVAGGSARGRRIRIRDIAAEINRLATQLNLLM